MLLNRQQTKFLILSLFIAGLVFVLMVGRLFLITDRESTRLNEARVRIMETQGDLDQLTKLSKDPALQTESLFWIMYSNSLLMAGGEDSDIKAAVASGLTHTNGWQFIRLVKTVEPYVIGYLPRKLSAYQEVIKDFKNPAISFDSDFIVKWKSCLDSFDGRYEGIAGRLTYYRDLLGEQDDELCPGLKSKATHIMARGG